MENYSESAFNIINNLLRVKKDNVISISGEIYNSEKSNDPLIEISLIEELAVAVRKKAAFPILDITTTNLQERFNNEMPENIYSQTSKYYKDWVNLIDSFIEVGWQKFSNEFEQNIKSSSHEMSESSQALFKQIFDNNKKMLFLNYPNAQLANYLDIDFKKLRSLYNEAINCDYRYLFKQGSLLKDRFFSSANYIIEDETCALELKISKDQASLNCGNPNENPQIILPAGFIEFPLIRPSLNGVINAEKIYYQNQLFTDVKIMFKDGNIRYVTFLHDHIENFQLKNALMHSSNNCLLTIGFNPDMGKYTNYTHYDRCLNENITITFFNSEKPNIFVSTLKGNISKFSKIK